MKHPHNIPAVPTYTLAGVPQPLTAAQVVRHLEPWGFDPAAVV